MESLGLKLLWEGIKAIVLGFLSGWWKEHKAQEAIKDAVKPYKKELEIKNRPAGSDDDVTDRL